MASTDSHIGIEVSGDGKQAIVLLCRVTQTVTDGKAIGMSSAISAEAQCLERHRQEACERAACCVPQSEHRPMQTKAARIIGRAEWSQLAGVERLASSSTSEEVT